MGFAGIRMTGCSRFQKDEKAKRKEEKMKKAGVWSYMVTVSIGYKGMEWRQKGKRKKKNKGWKQG